LCIFFYYCQIFPNFCNHLIVISTTLRSPDWKYIQYTQCSLLSINMWTKWLLSLPIKSIPGVLMSVSVRERRALNNQIFWRGKIYYFNTIIIAIPMYTLFPNCRCENTFYSKILH
jgi:hypothetical protein